jgi:hypothetical protein
MGGNMDKVVVVAANVAVAKLKLTALEVTTSPPESVTRAVTEYESPEVRFDAGRGKLQVVVPVTAMKVWLVALKAVPFHHRAVVVFSIATFTEEKVLPAATVAEPVMAPDQLVP